MNKPKLLIVDDDEAIRTQLKYALRDDVTLLFAEDRGGALTTLRAEHLELVSLDLGLPPHPDRRGGPEGARRDHEGGAGYQGDRPHGQRRSRKRHPCGPARGGAFDYHQKPIQLNELKVVLQRAEYLKTLEADSEKSLRASETTTRFEDILGNAPAMREIFGVVTRVAKTDATVLIQGESGTGKELLARAIHSKGARCNQPFVAINCGAIPETLLESELFGHEKGAYTGAYVQRKGKLEVAADGTLFLDEIGEMSGPLQVKLLRFLQQREIERVGGRELVRVDARVIAATNKDLKAELQSGRFREDLFYRLSVVNLKLPPLRERGDDVVLIANAFLRRSSQRHRRKLQFSASALESIIHHPWPGNIRELENTVERAVIMSKGKLIEPRDLGIDVG